MRAQAQVREAHLHENENHSHLSRKAKSVPGRISGIYAPIGKIYLTSGRVRPIIQWGSADLRAAQRNENHSQLTKYDKMRKNTLEINNLHADGFKTGGR